MPYSAVISKAIDKVPFLTVRGFLVKERGVSVAISDPHMFCSLVPHGIFSIKPTIKGFTDLLYMLKVMQWILFKDLELFLQPCYLVSNMAKLIFVLGG